jgi:hypothetical protein
MTNPVLNLGSPLVDIKTGKVIPPWNSFFQQFTQTAPAVSSITQNPFTANAIGKVIIIGAATITLTRGDTIVLVSGEKIIPISIGDTLSWTGSPTTVQWWGGI